VTATVQPEVVQSKDTVALLIDQVEHLERALASRDVIGQAKGILMERFRITADEAFERLRAASQHANRKLATLAEELAATGEWLWPDQASETAPSVEAS
jgi:AmiR/NasT family two-component response regulator